ncbi:MAG: hypothetical protein NZM04_09100 [Methylacidiphilales bacterium]|nr:hypothetical protein [Candidatus Methylacidiphilales bacterium]MDW8349841.1 hypothetical protein [Verrucomicrobiae bacterium]
MKTILTITIITAALITYLWAKNDISDTNRIVHLERKVTALENRINQLEEKLTQVHIAIPEIQGQPPLTQNGAPQTDSTPKELKKLTLYGQTFYILSIKATQLSQ